MNEPKISIIVPVYKTEKYLNRCLESIVNQTYKNLEIILIDDDSPDNCPQMCDEWAQKDNRIKVLHIENNGLANARNSGIDIATGDYVMFADSDDYLEPDMVEFLLNLSVKYDADVSRCGFYFNYENTGEEKSASSDTNIKLFDYDERMIDLTTGGHVSGVAWNKLYKSSVIKSHYYSKADGCSEDIMHNYRVYKDITKTAFCNIPKYHYVIRENSITNNTFGYGAFDIIRAKQIILDGEGNNEKILPYAIKGYVTSAFIVLSGCIRHNACMDRYDELRDSILRYKRNILTTNLYSKKDKIKTAILSISPSIYNKLIR
ncbi:MAG: glycosyltransferase [Eubacterium sp.]|nr:glycosyltransferase [Eubacterium sp.]